MTLPIDYDSDDYKFYKTLNEDVKLVPVGKGEHYDIQLKNGDYVNVSGKDSLSNAIVIAIMTRFNELSDIELYDEFGCKIHDLIKGNPTEMVEYEMVLCVQEVLENMRRIKEVPNINLIGQGDFYKILFQVIGINDDGLVEGSVVI